MCCIFYYFANSTCCKLQSCIGAKLQRWKVTKLPSFQVPKMHRGSKVQRCKGAKVQRCKDAKVRRCKDEKMQSYKLQTRLRTQTHTHAWTDPQMDKWTSWAAVTAKKWMEFSIKGLDPNTHLPYSTKRNNHKNTKTPHKKKSKSTCFFTFITPLPDQWHLGTLYFQYFKALNDSFLTKQKQTLLGPQHWAWFDKIVEVRNSFKLCKELSTSYWAWIILYLIWIRVNSYNI